MSECKVCGGTGKITTTGSMVMQERLLIGMSREAFALECGVTSQTIFLVEKDRVPPRTSTRNAISEVFKKNGVEFVWHG